MEALNSLKEKIWLGFVDPERPNAMENTLMWAKLNELIEVVNNLEINPKCGRPASECREGMNHIHG